MNIKRIGIVFDGEYTRIISSESGTIYDDLSLVCWNGLTTEVVVMGKDAKKMIDRVDKPLRVVAPLENDEVQNLEIFKDMVKVILENFKDHLEGAELIVSAPTIENEQIQKVILDIIKNFNYDSIEFVPRIFLAAVGANTDIDDEYGTVILDIDYYKTTVAVIAEREVLAYKQSTFAEKHLDDLLTQILKENFGLVVEQEIIEKIKWSLGSVIKLRDDLELIINGRDMITNERRTVTVNDSEFKKIFTQIFTSYKALVTSVLESCPMFIRTSVIKNGIKITGELAGIIGVKDFFADFFDVPVKTAKNRGYAIIDGALKYKKQP